jgi:hypothetical protein
MVEAAGVEGSHVGPSAAEDSLAPTTTSDHVTALGDPRVEALSHAVLQAVLDGDHEKARELAEQVRGLSSRPVRAVK